MLYQFLSNPILTGILSCLAPTVAFAGINATLFSNRQIFFASLFSLLVGGILGGILFFIPPLMGAVLACLAFFIFGERIFFSVFPTGKKRLLFCSTLLIISTLSAFWWGFLPFNILLIIYFILAIYDFYTRSQLPKSTAFDAQNFTFHEPDNIPAYYPVSLNKKPDIFILFAESIHGREALKELYDMDDKPLYEYLNKNNFTVHSNSFSNSWYTKSSLATMVNMNIIPTVTNNAPAAIQILHSNKYELQIFDSVLWSFADILKYANFFNLHIPKYIQKLYDLMLPFFMQSKYFMYLTNDVDPFFSGLSNDLIQKAIKQQVQKTYANPQCYIIRMGAEHAPAQSSWKNRKGWIPNYKKKYTEASSYLCETMDLILKHNPEALIAITGDHGAYCMNDIWSVQKNMDPNVNIMENGASPAVVTLSIASILMAVRWPNGEMGSDQVLTPCNLFRHIFSYLGGEGQILQPVENLVFFNTVHHPFILLAREGKPLDYWKVLSKDEMVALQKQQIQLQGVKSPDSEYKMIEIFIDNGQYDNALQSSTEAVGMYPDKLELFFQLVNLLMRTGKIIRAEKLCESLMSKMPHNVQLLEHYLIILALQGRIEKALQLLSDMDEYIKNTEKLHSDIFCLAGDKSKAIEAAQQYFENILANKDNKLNIEIYWLSLRSLVLQLDAIGQMKKAFDIMNYPVPTFKTSDSMHLKSMLLLQTYNWEESEKALRLFMEITRDSHNNLRHIVLIGLLEQQGKIDQALEIFKVKKDVFSTFAQFDVYKGLFIIRNKLSGAGFDVYEKAASEYLAREKEWLEQRKLFDAKWYGNKYADILNGKSPMEHYLHYHQFLFLDPNPLFNQRFYYFTNWVAIQLSMEALHHFIAASPFENRNPSIYFDVRAYMAQHPEAANTNVNTLVHHLCPEFYE